VIDGRRYLPVLPRELVASSEQWFPKESFSPSQLERFSLCRRKWAYRYLWGVREAKKRKSAMLGSLIHAAIEAYLRGSSVYQIVISEDLAKELAPFSDPERAEMMREASRRALAGLHLLPKLHECEAVELEQWIDVDTRRVLANVEPIKITGKIDLSFRRAGHWYTVDHKSTRGKQVTGEGFKPWFYAKQPDELLNDPQGVFYPLDRVHKHNLAGIWSRWVYYLTDPKHHPQAEPVDFYASREHLEHAAHGWLLEAVEMRQLVRAAIAGSIRPDDLPLPAKLPPDPLSPCLAFGGCPYRAEVGGPCRSSAGIDFGSLLLPTTPIGENIMSADLAAQLDAMRPNLPPGAPIPGSALLPPEAHQQPPAQQAPAQYPGWVWNGVQWVQDPAYAPPPPPPAAAPPPPPVAQNAPPGAPPPPPPGPPPAPPPAVTTSAPPPPPPAASTDAPATGGRGKKGKKDATLGDTALDKILEHAPNDPNLGSLTVGQLKAIQTALNG
jgi:hypothetical protein